MSFTATAEKISRTREDARSTKSNKRKNYKRCKLVRKIETSPSRRPRKRNKQNVRKIRAALTELKRIAESHKLIAYSVTLTFRDNREFASKNISRFLDHIRRRLDRSGHAFHYMWVLESEGRLHYHLILWLPAEFPLGPEILKKYWPWGRSKIERCKSVKRWGNYLSKCNSSSQLPKGAKQFGVGGLDVEGRIAVSRAGLPQWLLKNLPPNHTARRATGGAWVTADGKVFRSPYIWTPKGFLLVCEP